MSKENSAQLFEIASRKKFRFQTSKSFLCVEDLWDIPLEGREYSLDTVAQILDENIKETSSKKSFVSKKTSASEELQQKFDLVLHIIEVRVAEKDQKLAEAENRESNKKIRELIAEKKDDELKGKSVEELEALLKK